MLLMQLPCCAHAAKRRALRRRCYATQDDGAAVMKIALMLAMSAPKFFVTSATRLFTSAHATPIVYSSSPPADSPRLHSPAAEIPRPISSSPFFREAQAFSRLHLLAIHRPPLFATPASALFLSFFFCFILPSFAASAHARIYACFARCRRCCHQRLATIYELIERRACPPPFAYRRCRRYAVTQRFRRRRRATSFRCLPLPPIYERAYAAHA